MKEQLQEAAEECGRGLLIDPGTPAPSAPARTEPQPGQPRTTEIALEDKPEEKMEDVIFQELPWEKALKKTLPPESAVMSEPALKEAEQRKGRQVLCGFRWFKSD